MRTILLHVPDMMFETRIADTVRALGHRVEAFSVSSGPLSSASLVIVGLENNRDWQRVVEMARSRHVPVLAFGRHTSVELLRQAQAAGCNQVVANSAIAENLSSLLKKFLPD